MPHSSVWDYFQKFILVERWYLKVLLFFVLSFAVWSVSGHPLGVRLRRWMQGHVIIILGGIFLLALVLRLAWVWWVPHAVFGEEKLLLEPARNIAEGHGYAIDGKLSARRSIAYCVLISVFFFLKHPLGWIHVLNLLLSSATVFLFYGIGREIAGKGPGLLAAFLWAIYPTSVFASSLILDEHMALPLMLLGVYCAIRYVRVSHVRMLVGTGLTWGISALARPIAVILPFALGMGLWAGGFSSRQALKNFLLVMTLVIACAVPWAVRNWIQLGIPIFYSTQNYGFYWANNPYYEVDNPRAPLLEEHGDVEMHEAQAQMGEGYAQEARYSNLAVRRALAWIKRDPLTFLRKTIGKTLHFLTFSQEEWAINYNFDTLQPSRLGPNKSVVLWLMIKPQNWFYVWMLLGTLGGTGFFLCSWCKGEKNAPFLFVALCGMAVLALTVLFIPQLKYRYMLDPFLILGSTYYSVRLLKNSAA